MDNKKLYIVTFTINKDDGTENVMEMVQFLKWANSGSSAIDLVATDFGKNEKYKRWSIILSSAQEVPQLIEFGNELKK